MNKFTVNIGIQHVKKKKIQDSAFFSFGTAKKKNFEHSTFFFYFFIFEKTNIGTTTTSH